MQLPKGFCGISCPQEESEDQPIEQICLPLENLFANVTIIDVSAVVTLRQKFWQYLPSQVNRARYVFPVPSRAAVCGFEMRTQDGQVIKAVAKEKEQARKEHDAAIQQGKMTSLVERVTDDIFSVSLGALPASQIITTTVTYVMDLMDADLTDQVRFQLPVCVGMRYGFPPDGMAPPLNTTSRIDLTANIRMKGAIRSITSPTHNLTTSGVSALFSSDSYLQSDLVLVVRADGLDEPRCFAERHPTGTVAMQLSMVPKFAPSPISAQEYIFLIDRSGSMEGDRIETAKAALVMLLRALPAKGTTFNIFSFGDRCKSLFATSVGYNELSLKKATKHVDRMNADYGGTEVKSALRKVFSSCSKEVPTACFVLTDGEAYDVDDTLNEVKKAVGTASAQAPLAVFTLGIGQTVSSAMCEGISREGNGICLMAATSESIVAKAAKLVKASRMHVYKDVRIDWGAHFSASPDVTSQSDMLRQAPLKTPPLYAGSRYVVFALLKHQDFVIPEKITVRAQQREGEGQDVTIEIPVIEHTHTADDAHLHLIHTLAARKIIQDFDDASRNDGAESTKSATIHLGEQYQLASRFTSFIAVDEHGVVAPEMPRTSHAKRKSVGGKRARVALPVAAMDDFLEDDEEGDDSENLGRVSPYVGEDEDEDEDDWDAIDYASSAPNVPMACQPSRGRGSDSSAEEESDEDMGYSLFDDGHTAPPSAPRPSKRARLERSDSDSSDADDTLAFTSLSPSAAGQDTETTGTGGVVVLSLVRLQSFDGSFAATPRFEQIVGADALLQADTHGVDKTIWATVLAVAYLQKYMIGQPELLEGLVEKAADYVAQSPDANFRELLDAAKLLVV